MNNAKKPTVKREIAYCSYCSKKKMTERIGTADTVRICVKCKHEV